MHGWIKVQFSLSENGFLISNVRNLAIEKIFEFIKIFWVIFRNQNVEYMISEVVFWYKKKCIIFTSEILYLDSV